MKKLLSNWQIWNMNVGLIGINFGWGLQMANMSAIYEYLGAQPNRIPILWLAAPLTGLLIQPIIGYFSDHTWGRFGRRKPYILVGAILSSLSLIFMPLSTALWMAAMTLWVLDACVNISMGPFRALVPDLLPEEQMTKGFIIQSMSIATGAVTAYALPYILEHVFGMSNHTSATQAIPNIVLWSFWIGSAVFMVSILWTVFTTKELPPEVTTVSESKSEAPLGSFITEIWSDLRNIPKKMWDLAWVMIFSWMGLFCLFLYFSIAVANNVFMAKPNTPQYLAGIEWAGICFAAYSLFFLFTSFLLSWLTKYLHRRHIYMVALICGAIGMMSVYFITSKWLLFLSMLGVGIAFASMQSMPYAMLADALPKDKLGIYMGVFNLFIVIPEILISVGFGFIMQYVLHNNRVLGVVAGGVFMLIASVLTFRIQDKNKTVTPA